MHFFPHLSIFSPAALAALIEQGALSFDTRLRSVVLDVLLAGRMPLPDRLFSLCDPCYDASADVFPGLRGFRELQLQRRGSGSSSALQLECSSPATAISASFLNAEAIEGLLHGAADRGVTCRVEGEVSVRGVRLPLVGALAHLRVCGGLFPLGAQQAPMVLRLPAVHSGECITAIESASGGDDGRVLLHNVPLARLPEGSARASTADAQPQTATFEEGLGGSAPAAGGAGASGEAAAPPWLSTQTFNVYPQQFRLCTSPGQPGEGEFVVAAEAPSCELVSLLACPGLWVGRIRVSRRGTGEVVGYGTLMRASQRSAGGSLARLDDFFRSVGVATRDAVCRVLPDALSEENVVQLFATSATTPWQTAGAPPELLHANLVAPVRHLVDAGGKSWRSYGIVAACDAVGGCSNDHRDFLALAELLHVGSLIVDDLQDQSPLRRGKEAVHLKFSPAVAINSATSAYFTCERIITHASAALPPQVTLRLFEQYFGCMRAGHAGQALDIAGLEYLMEEAIASARGRELAEQRLLAVHMLKTGVPAASLLRIGAVLGGGSEEQVMALGRYYEAVGCAFQIMDDVRNLRGVFSGSADKSGAGVALKVLGEDITAGKVTFPLVKALKRLPEGDMRALWEVVKTKPADAGIVAGVIAKLEACGAIDACVEHASKLVKEGQQRINDALPDSLWKCLLLAFGGYLVELQ